MTSYHILIVDDQHDVRRVLSSGLQTLGQQIGVVDVPSAEEALLIAPRHSYDLIVTDVKLPGISGLELVRRVKLRNPGIKIILMTGAEDRQTRRQVEEAGVFAFFYKPIEMADFLDAVERALGLVETVFTPPPLDLKLVKDELAQTEPLTAGQQKDEPKPAHEAEAQTPAPLAPLAALVLAPDILYAALINAAGETLSQAGECREMNGDPAILAGLLAVAKANHTLSAALARPVPDYSLFLDGTSLSAGLAPVGKDHILLVIGSQSFQGSLDRIGSAMRGAIDELLEYIMHRRFADQPVSANVDNKSEEAAVVSPEGTQLEIQADEDLLASLAHIEVSADDLAAIENLFGAPTDVKTGSLDDFWDTAVEETGNPSLNESHISYDEARDLGLAPD